ncbi:MAG: Fic family protein [Rhizobiaceae bacterium]|jgi:fido (protein-threonine AMPylation protein)|nr:Fic family protein [Rhizobiaceae bacterium]
MSGDDPYCYPETDVLRNRLGVTDPVAHQRVERAVTSAALVDLAKDPVSGDYDARHFLEINRRVFGRFYEWAGHPRIYDLEKPEVALGGKSVEYGHHKTIDADLDREMSALSRFQWDDKDKLTSASKFASHITAIWKIHPFREGNTRTVGALIRQFSKDRGFELDHDTFWERAAETRDALAKATIGQPKDLIKTILTAHQIGKDRNHPDLGRITSQTAHVLRFMNKPEISFPKQGEKVSGQVLDVSYGTVLIGNGRSVQAVSDRNFTVRPAANMRVGTLVTHALEPVSKSKTLELDRSAPDRSHVSSGAERATGEGRNSPARIVLTPPKSNDRDRDR